MSRSRRARFRNRGRRKEQLKAEKELLWQKLSSTFKKVDITFDLEAGMFYCPYVPIMKTVVYGPTV